MELPYIHLAVRNLFSFSTAQTQRKIHGKKLVKTSDEFVKKKLKLAI